MPHISVFGVLLLVLIPAVARSEQPVQVVDARPEPVWDARFQRTDGWLGADGNYSIRVAPDRVLWFFSDTLVGRIAGGKRVDCRMVNNSVGVQTGKDGREAIEFFYRSDQDGQPQSMFRPDDSAHWEWLLGGTEIEGKVHLMTWEFRKSGDPGVFGFAICGVNHIEIENPLDRPTDWRYQRRPLPFTEITEKRRLVLGSSIMKSGDYVYVYGTLETPDQKHSPRGMILARAPSATFADHRTWTFRTSTGWSSNFLDSKELFAGIASEYSVSQLPGQASYICISHGDLLSPRIQARFAPEPFGPWSPAVDVWNCPEPAAHKGYFAYSGKAHPEISSDNELLVTYAVNSFQFGDLFSDPSLYWPRFVRVKLSSPER